MTKRKSKSTKSTVKAAAAKRSVTKSSAVPATAATPPLIVLGFDEQQKPRGRSRESQSPSLSPNTHALFNEESQSFLQVLLLFRNAVAPEASSLSAKRAVRSHRKAAHQTRNAEILRRPTLSSFCEIPRVRYDHSECEVSNPAAPGTKRSVWNAPGRASPRSRAGARRFLIRNDPSRRVSSRHRSECRRALVAMTASSSSYPLPRDTFLRTNRGMQHYPSPYIDLKNGEQSSGFSYAISGDETDRTR
jgi:hypothetical protein